MEKEKTVLLGWGAGLRHLGRTQSQVARMGGNQEKLVTQSMFSSKGTLDGSGTG